MDLSIKNIILDIDGQIVRYDHGPQIPTPVVWPGPRGAGAGARAGQPAGLGNDLRHGLRRAVGAVAPVRPVSFEPVANSQVTLPRHLRHRRPQGGVRGHGEQRAQSVPAARAARLPVPDGPVTLRRASSSSEMNQTSCRRRHQRGRGLVRQALVARRLRAAAHARRAVRARSTAGCRRRCATAASSSASAGSTST